jgi:lysine-specific histone demethylase 1
MGLDCGRILAYIANQSQVPIRLNRTVQKILTTDPNRIEIHTSKEKGRIFCRRVILTVPLGCLKHQTIRFELPLPDWKLQSINQMHFDLLNKLLVPYSDCFWSSSTTGT